MKKLILLLFIPLVSFGQSETENNGRLNYEMIESVPIFPGCKRGNNEKKRKCMSDKIAKFIAKEFDVGCADGLGFSGRQRISVIFKFDTLGRAVEVKARARHPKLEREAVRVVKMLPIVKPGTQDGKKVIVPYSLPIFFMAN